MAYYFIGMHAVFFFLEVNFLEVPRAPILYSSQELHGKVGAPLVVVARGKGHGHRVAPRFTGVRAIIAGI